MYGSIFCIATLRPCCSSSIPRLAQVRPLPRELVTPPVTKMCFTARGGRVGSVTGPVSSSRAALLRNARASDELVVVLARVDARRGAPSEDHADRPSVLERAKLFQALRTLERRLRQARELEQGFAPERVDAHVTPRRRLFV